MKSSFPPFRLATIPDLSLTTNESLFGETAASFISTNDSLNQVNCFVEDIINEAINKIFPNESHSQDDIIDVVSINSNYENGLLLDLEDNEKTNETALNRTFDLDAEIGKVTNSMLTLQLGMEIVEKCELPHNLGCDKSIQKDIDAKESIVNITSGDYANITQEIMNVSAMNIVQELIEDNHEEYKIMQELNSTKEMKDDNKIEVPQVIDCEVPECKHEKEYLDKMNVINQLNEVVVSKNEVIATKNQDLDEIRGKILQKETEYNVLMQDHNRKDREIAEMKSKLEEYKRLKHNYTQKEAEIENLKMKCEDYDVLKRNYDEKQAENVQLTRKYEDALKQATTPVSFAKNTEELDFYKTELAVKEKEFEEIMKNYTELLEAQLAKYATLNEECCMVKKHLANSEIAFSDVHQKYERSKAIIEGYKTNEEKLKSTLVIYQATLEKWEEKMKVQQRNQVENERLKKELDQVKEDYASKMSKYASKIKHLEIKTSSLTNALEQKTKECQDLTKLCEEVIDIKSGTTSADQLESEVFPVD